MDLLSKPDDRLALPDVVDTTGPACDWCTAKMTKVHSNKQYTVNDFMIECDERRQEWRNESWMMKTNPVTSVFIYTTANQ